MTKHLFGWDYPPGAASDPNAPYNQTDDMTPESEHVEEVLTKPGYTIGDEYAMGPIAEVTQYVDELAHERNRLKELLQATVRYLPQRGPEPPCTCDKPDEYGYKYCDLHDSDWSELTLREEIENQLKSKEESK